MAEILPEIRKREEEQREGQKILSQGLKGAIRGRRTSGGSGWADLV